MENRSNAFSLIELTVILTIISVLVVIALPPLMNAHLRAEIARVNTDLQSIESAIEMFHLDNESYPSHATPVLSNNGSNEGSELIQLVEPVPYLNELPEDRLGRGSYAFGASNYGVHTGTPQKAWIAASVGPNRSLDSKHLDDFPEGTIVEEYSPINGLRSAGDIVRFGGNYSRGHWYLNGQKMGR